MERDAPPRPNAPPGNHLRWVENLTFDPKMSAKPIPQPQSRAESYRELAMEAINRTGEYEAKAEQYALQGDTQVAAEYRQLAAEAKTHAVRYTVLADFAEKNS